YATLPTVSFVVPNVSNDMHDGPEPDKITLADTWLKTHLDGYVQWAATHNSLLLVTFDEDERFDQNRITTLFVGPMVTPGQYSESITHHTVLRTLEDMYGLPYAGASASTTPITDVWTTAGGVGAAPAFTVVGTSLCVTGTNGNDVLTFSPDSTGYQLVVNSGIPYHVDLAQIQTILWDGGPGQDTAQLTGGAGAEELRLWNGGARQSGPGYSFALNNTEKVYGFGSTNDTAYFTDAPGSQLFRGTPT